MRLRLCPKVLVSDYGAWQFGSQFTLRRVYGSRGVCLFLVVMLKTPEFSYVASSAHRWSSTKLQLAALRPPQILVPFSWAISDF